MRILKHRKQDRVDRRMALEGVPTLRPGVSLEDTDDGNVRVTMTIKRGSGFFERMRPPETQRSYELDEFGSFVVKLVDGERTVLDVVNEFEKRFKMSRREIELSVVAFFKLLMQRNVLGVVVPRDDGPKTMSTVLACLLLGVAAFSSAGPAAGSETPADTIQSHGGKNLPLKK